MDIDIDALKKATKEAIEQGMNDKKVRERSEALKKATADEAMKAVANLVIADIPRLCRDAAAKGESRCFVFKERYYDFHKSVFINGGWEATIIGGPGLLIIESCKKIKLNVEVLARDDGCGMESWAEIWVNWED